MRNNGNLMKDFMTYLMNVEKSCGKKQLSAISVQFKTQILILKDRSQES